MAWVWDIFDVGAGLASIIGLVITIQVWRRVRLIEASFRRQALLPMYLRKLGAAIKNLKQAQRQKNAERIVSVATVSRATLLDLLAHLDESRTQRVRNLIHVLGEMRLERALEQSGSLIADLEAVCETVGNFAQEIQWRGRDV